MKSIKQIILISLAMLLCNATFARHIGRWDKIVTTSVSNTTDRDVVECSHKGLFKALKFKVEGSRAVDFKAVYIQYGNGVIDKLDFDQTVRAGHYSRLLDLRGDKRIIKKITLYYKTVNRKHGHSHPKQARVQIWGLHP